MRSAKPRWPPIPWRYHLQENNPQRSQLRLPLSMKGCVGRQKGVGLCRRAMNTHYVDFGTRPFGPGLTVHAGHLSGFISNQSDIFTKPQTCNSMVCQIPRPSLCLFKLICSPSFPQQWPSFCTAQPHQHWGWFTCSTCQKSSSFPHLFLLQSLQQHRVSQQLQEWQSHTSR